MAVIKSQSTRRSVALIAYTLRPKKGQKGERYLYASGTNGLLAGVAEAQFRDVRKKFGKEQYVLRPNESGVPVATSRYVQAYGLVQAFGTDELDPENPDDWERAHELGLAFAEDRFPSRQVLVVTQRDGRTGCLHNHIVVNSIDLETGRSLDSSTVTHSALAIEHDRVLAEHGFTQRTDLAEVAEAAKESYARGESGRFKGKHERGHDEAKEAADYIEWEAEQNSVEDVADGHTTRAEPFSLSVLKWRIEQAKQDPTAVDWDAFIVAAAEQHVRVAERGRKGTVTYGMMRQQPDGTFAEPAKSDTRRSTSLGDGYRRADIEAAVERNAQKAQQTEAPTTFEGKAPAEPGPRQPVSSPVQTPSEPVLAKAAEEETVDPTLADLVIVDAGFVKYGMYQPDQSAMLNAGVDPLLLKGATRAWKSLTPDEQRHRYEAAQEALEAVETPSVEPETEEHVEPALPTAERLTEQAKKRTARRRAAIEQATEAEQADRVASRLARHPELRGVKVDRFGLTDWGQEADEQREA